MKASYKIINAEDFLKTDINGQVDFKASMIILNDVISRMKEEGNYLVLVDMRKTTSILNVSDIYLIAQELTNYHHILHDDKIAILLGSQHSEEKAAFLELAAENRGLNIKTFFNDFEGAVNWLLEGNNS